MSDNKLRPVSQEAVDEIEYMQRRCVVTSYRVISSLEDGMSELQVANMFAEELAKEGITDYWYKFPLGVERIVLFGEKRFQDMVSEKYEEKTPRENVKLKPRDLVYFAILPRSQSGYWGSFSASGIYKPEHADQARVTFIETIQGIQKEVIKQLSPAMTGKEVYAMFMSLYEKEGISVVDVRGNFGLRMLHGEKTKTIWQDVPYPFLDEKNELPIVGQIFGIEPGGKRDMLCGRLQDCIYIPPAEGPARILGRDIHHPFPAVFPVKGS